MMEGVDAICSKKKTRHYADGGLVRSGYDNPARQVAGVTNLISGFQKGLAGYERENAFKEDREFLKEDRAYQKTQRDRQEEAQQMQMGVRKAAGQFAASGGVDVKPLIDLHNQRNPDSKIDLTPNDDGSFALVTRRADGSEVVKAIKPEEVRTYGMNLTQSLSDPNAYFASQEKLEERRREFSEKMSLLKAKHNFDRKSGSGSGTVQLLNWIQDSFDVDGNEAWDIYKSTAENPRAMASTTYGKLIANRDKAWDPSDPSRPSDDDIWKTTMDTVRRIQGADFAGPSNRHGKGQRPSGPPVETNGMRRQGLGMSDAAYTGPLSGLTPLEEAPMSSAPTAQTAPAPARAPAVRQTAATGSSASIPPEAIAHLKANAGKVVRFGNGQVMTADVNGNVMRLVDGQMVPVE